MQQKKKIEKLNCKIKNFCASKDTISKVKRQPIGETLSDKGSVSRIYVSRISYISKTKDKEPNLKTGKDLNRYFSKEDIKMANKHTMHQSLGKCKSKPQ